MSKTDELREELRTAIGGVEGVRVHRDGMLTQESVAAIVETVAIALDRAGLLVDGRPPETPTTRVLAERADVIVEEAPEGDPGMEAVQAWFRNGGC